MVEYKVLSLNIIKNQSVMLYLDKQPKRGDTIKYQRKIMYKGWEVVTAKIVSIFNNTILFDNGDNAYFLVNN